MNNEQRLAKQRKVDRMFRKINSMSTSRYGGVKLNSVCVAADIRKSRTHCTAGQGRVCIGRN